MLANINYTKILFHLIFPFILSSFSQNSLHFHIFFIHTCWIGDIFYHGKCVIIDKEIAKKCYKLAADSGFDDSMNKYAKKSYLVIEFLLTRKNQLIILKKQLMKLFNYQDTINASIKQLNV